MSSNKPTKIDGVLLIVQIVQVTGRLARDKNSNEALVSTGWPPPAAPR